jgi:hypothetical protein
MIASHHGIKLTPHGIHENCIRRKWTGNINVVGSARHNDWRKPLDFFFAE